MENFNDKIAVAAWQFFGDKSNVMSQICYNFAPKFKIA